MSARSLILSLVTLALFSTPASAWEPGWWGVVFAQGEDKARIEATPILQRPYRPFHFYGNPVRRKYYRGHAMLMPRDVVNGAHALVFKRELEL